MRQIDESAIKRHSDQRFRSEYDYALFEYYRSAKVIAYLEQAGVSIAGRILDAGCGGGGMPVSFAEEAQSLTAIDLTPRFSDAGTRLAAERAVRNVSFAVADGLWLPFRSESFDMVMSHAVIEHVADAARYLRECHRVLKPDGRMYLSTSPYLSFAGAHLPRLKVPFPLHLLFGRRAAFATFRHLAKHAPWTLREPEHENTFIKAAKADAIKHDDLLEKVRIGRMRTLILDAGFEILRESLHQTRTFRRLPGPIARWLRESALTQDVVVGAIEYVLRIDGADGNRFASIMADIVRFRLEDRRAIDTLYRRVFGHDAANASHLRWHWQYLQNPNNPPDGPQIWLAREGPTIVGQYATMPVRLTLKGQDLAGSWGMDVMVAPERQRQGIGEVLFRTWDQNVGASLGLGLSPSSHRLFQKMKWPEVGPVPCLVKPLTRRAVRRPTWPMPLNRLVSALTYPYIRYVSRTKPLRAQIEPIRHFDARFTELWERVAPSFGLSVRRDAPYLNWKYIEPPHVRYSVVALKRDETIGGYAVYRHLQEPRGRVTVLVDFLVDPSDHAGFETLLRWVDREARAADSDKVRLFAMHAGFRKLLRHSGYFTVKSTLQFTIKVNAAPVPDGFYEHTDDWHFTLGDSDQDR